MTKRLVTGFVTYRTSKTRSTFSRIVKQGVQMFGNFSTYVCRHNRDVWNTLQSPEIRSSIRFTYEPSNNFRTLEQNLFKPLLFLAVRLFGNLFNFVRKAYSGFTVWPLPLLALRTV